MFTETISIKELNKLPRKMGLYGVFFNELLLYIGISWNLRNRFCRHHKLNAFYEAGANLIKYKVYDDREQLHDDEHSAIINLKPRLNVFHHRRTTVRPKRNNNSDTTYYKLLTEKIAYKNLRTIAELTWEYVLSGESREDAVRELSKHTGLNIHWINYFLKNPEGGSFIKVESLYYYLSGGKNSIDID